MQFPRGNSLIHGLWGLQIVDCMKYLTKVKDYLQIRGEMSKNVTASFSEVENLLLKTKVEEKKQSNITDFFRK